MSQTSAKIHKIVGLGLFTAIVFVLQMMGAFIRFGPFSISLVLLPIVIGAALYGVVGGAWLGFVFGMAVLISGDASAFMIVNVPATLAIVLVKGTFAGLCAGLIYRIAAKMNRYLGVVAAALVAPVVNTGLFLLGCIIFFMPTIELWGAESGFATGAAYLIYGMVGLNFVVELLINLSLSPVVLRLLRAAGLKN